MLSGKEETIWLLMVSVYLVQKSGYLPMKLRTRLPISDQLYLVMIYVVNQALVYAKEKVPGHYDINRMVPGYQSLVAEDYGKRLSSIITPIVASKLPLTG